MSGLFSLEPEQQGLAPVGWPKASEYREYRFGRAPARPSAVAWRPRVSRGVEEVKVASWEGPHKGRRIHNSPDENRNASWEVYALQRSRINPIKPELCVSDRSSQLASLS